MNDPFLRFLSAQIARTMLDLDDVKEEVQRYDVENTGELNGYIQALFYKMELEERLNRLWNTRNRWEAFLDANEENSTETNNGYEAGRAAKKGTIL